jgi:hypothetical protein
MTPINPPESDPSHETLTFYIALSPSVQSFYARRGMWADGEPRGALAGWLGPRWGLSGKGGVGGESVVHWTSAEGLAGMAADVQAAAPGEWRTLQLRAQFLRRLREAAARGRRRVEAIKALQAPSAPPAVPAAPLPRNPGIGAPSAADLAELHRLAATALTALQPLARRLSRKSADLVGSFLMVCAASRGDGPDAVALAVGDVLACIEADDRRRATAAPVLRLVPRRADAGAPR